MKRVVLAITACLLLLSVTVLVAGNWLWQRWQQPIGLPVEGYPLIVESGDTLRGVAEELTEAGVLEDPWMLRFYARLKALDDQIKRGEYLLHPPLTQSSLLRQLVDGDIVTYQVTIPEGLTLAQALTVLARDPVLVPELTGARDQRLLELAQGAATAEGLFLPETYRFERGDSDWQIMQRAHVALKQTLDAAWADRDAGLPYESPYEALVMASIVERETGVPGERREIAGVFVRRIMKNMRLQTDPTVIYGLGEGFDGNLRRTHLRDDSNPYNTYRHKGLPPTPIALPGRAAIEAAMHPLPGETLFFVARGDGSHQFSITLEAHEEAVRKYQLSRRSDYRSSPPPSSDPNTNR
ncbi:endolytic transglycosylase MltG [Parahalioglobus pacificus]|uniref:Endolytic murein transglycosylase n=1 Tax=Parahalioglobus pacificus TaxID=930806 RepID=A0A918XF85_9GAMM|nr:endolytic transglycosylase MltG [Halioglobus pacificus]GHD29790.1 hypothetical protein GCM10007053_10890 [Halioglobus pacificus]